MLACGADGPYVCRRSDPTLVGVLMAHGGLAMTPFLCQHPPLGTADSASSGVWLTVSKGILNEVYYSTIDQPQIRDQQDPYHGRHPDESTGTASFPIDVDDTLLPPGGLCADGPGGDRYSPSLEGAPASTLPSGRFSAPFRPAEARLTPLSHPGQGFPTRGAPLARRMRLSKCHGAESHRCVVARRAGLPAAPEVSRRRSLPA